MTSRVCVVLVLIMCRTQHPHHHVTACQSFKTVAHFPLPIKQVLDGNNTAWSTLDIAHKVMMVACYINHLVFFSFGMMTDSSVQWIPLRMRREPVCFCVCRVQNCDILDRYNINCVFNEWNYIIRHINVLLHVCYSVLAYAVAVTSIFMTGVKHSDSN